MFELRGRPGRINKTPYESLLQTEYLAGCSEQCALIEYEDYETQIKAWFEDSFQKTVSIPLYDDKQLVAQYADMYRGVYRPVDYREMYTDDAASRVEELFADEIEIFNFKL